MFYRTLSGLYPAQRWALEFSADGPIFDSYAPPPKWEVMSYLFEQLLS